MNSYFPWSRHHVLYLLLSRESSYERIKIKKSAENLKNNNTYLKINYK